MLLERQQLIRSLFDEYIEMYASRDDRLTSRFSEDFTGCTGGGDSLVKGRDEWVKITRLDFSQATGRIRIELLDLAMQEISDDVAVVTSSFHIHRPVPCARTIAESGAAGPRFPAGGRGLDDRA